MTVVNQKLNLDQPATYQIKVPGRLDENLIVWVEGMTITVEREDDGLPYRPPEDLKPGAS